MIDSSSNWEHRTSWQASSWDVLDSDTVFSLACHYSLLINSVLASFSKFGCFAIMLHVPSSRSKECKAISLSREYSSESCMRPFLHICIYSSTITCCAVLQLSLCIHVWYYLICKLELSVVCVIIMNKCKQERAAVHCHWWPTQTKFSLVQWTR